MSEVRNNSQTELRKNDIGKESVTESVKESAKESMLKESMALGITFSGEKFIVPTTHDMLKTLFDPKIKKSYLELIILIVIFSNFFLLYLLPQNLRTPIFISLYIFWRLSYNFGIGYCLKEQSTHHSVVKWFGTVYNSRFGWLLKKEITSQRGLNYNIESFPQDFNTWLIFRRFVDLILMNDFTTFFCMTISCAIDSNWLNHPLYLIFLRISFGFIFIIFNFWVKNNAHSIIKDYAWYWGDFFFRQINNEDLIFDGVFEMFPHPMYSIGYIGYYGFALISKSYTVLFVSIFGHFLQMIFLHYIENPHINKIYGPSLDTLNYQKFAKLKDIKNFDNLPPLIGLFNFSFLRSSDIINLFLVVLACYNSNFYTTLTIKIIELIFINSILILQSWKKFYTKWYLSMDIPIEKSLNNWAILYNSVISLTYASLIGFNISYVLNKNFDSFLFNNYLSLRLLFGTFFIITQIWINSSIVESIGYFGWFYGDFFVPKSQSAFHLTKVGVYRYLNNPEQIFGVCGVMGIFLILPSLENLLLCGLWVSNNFIRINFIEKPHMIKVYGETSVLQDSGVTKTFKKHLIPDVIKRLTEEHAASTLSDRNRRPSSSFSDKFDHLIKDLKNSNQKISKQKISELTQKLNFENSEYKLTINDLVVNSDNSKSTNIGQPIKISWESPKDLHTDKDWIGLYKITQTAYARNKTMITSNGRWTNCDSYKGSYIFEKEKLFWEEGIYEFRFHLSGKHEVVYISEPFEIKSTKIEVPIDSLDLNQFSNKLKTDIFDNLLSIPTVDNEIIKYINALPNAFDIYSKLDYIILKSTEIKINTKILLANHNDFTIKTLSHRLIDIKKVLEELNPTDINPNKKDV